MGCCSLSSVKLKATSCKLVFLCVKILMCSSSEYLNCGPKLCVASELRALSKIYPLNLCSQYTSIFLIVFLCSNLLILSLLPSVILCLFLMTDRKIKAFWLHRIWVPWGCSYSWAIYPYLQNPRIHPDIFFPLSYLGFLGQLQVAKVVADTMHNYLLFEHLLQVRLIPPEHVHPRL